MIRQRAGIWYSSWHQYGKFCLRFKLNPEIWILRYNPSISVVDETWESKKGFSAVANGRWMIIVLWKLMFKKARAEFVLESLALLGSSAWPQSVYCLARSTGISSFPEQCHPDLQQQQQHSKYKKQRINSLMVGCESTWLKSVLFPDKVNESD